MDKNLNEIEGSNTIDKVKSDSEDINEGLELFRDREFQNNIYIPANIDEKKAKKANKRKRSENDLTFELIETLPKDIKNIKSELAFRLPMCQQHLKDFINEKMFLVDKSDYILKLIKIQKGIITRPRRFGKSLTISFLENMFRGNREVFEKINPEMKILQPYSWD